MDVAEITLRIVHNDDVIPHEGLDPGVVQRLAERLRTDGILRNPPIVVEACGQYIVLDGATRTGALRVLGVRDSLVQIVDYTAQNICLDRWNHLLQSVTPMELMEQIEAIGGVSIEPADEREAEHELAIRKILCYILLRNGSVYAVRGGQGLEASVKQLNVLVSLYRGQSEVYRAVTTQLDLLLREYPALSAVVVFPRFTPPEVMQLALNGAKLPMGITRHLIGGRAIGANIDLARLASDESLEAKNAWLDQWLMQKIHARKVRFYQEPLFVFDE